MTMTTTVECDMEGTKCHKKADKPQGSPPEDWTVIQGNKRIDLCPSCTTHARRQLEGQS